MKVLIVGAGPAGYPCAIELAQKGVEVTLAEKAYPGGVCLNWGCIPSKSLLDSAHRITDAQGLGMLLEEGKADFLKDILPNVSWEKIQTRRADTINKLREGLLKMFKAYKVNYVTGSVQFKNNTAAKITSSDGKTEEVTFDRAVIAAGTKAFVPPLFNDVKESVLDNVSVFGLEKLPSSIAIVGGGAIGVEFACVFHALGVKVHLIEMMPALLPGVDEAAVRVLQMSYKQRGIEMHLGQAVTSAKHNGDKVEVTLANGNIVEAEKILCAIGRVCDLSDLGLENCGVKWDRKGIKVNDKMETEIPNFYAIGDVNGLSMFAHSAHKQGSILADNLTGGDRSFKDALVPACIYSWPEISSIGLSKKQAEEKGFRVKVAKSYFMANGRALSQGTPEGFVQVIAVQDTLQILGVQIAGAGASEMIHAANIIIRSKMTAKDVRDIIFAHPTMSESLYEAIEALNH